MRWRGRGETRCQRLKASRVPSMSRARARSGRRQESWRLPGSPGPPSIPITANSWPCGQRTLPLAAWLSVVLNFVPHTGHSRSTASSLRRPSISLTLHRAAYQSRRASPPLLALLSGSLAKPELLHLELEPLARDLEEPRRVGHVAGGLLQSAADELLLEPAHGDLHVLLEASFPGERGVQVCLGKRHVRDHRNAANVGREVLGVQLGFVAEEHRSLDDVLELADVAGPRVLDEDLGRVRVDAFDLLPEALVELHEEVLGEERDVAGALA